MSGEIRVPRMEESDYGASSVVEVDLDGRTFQLTVSNGVTGFSVELLMVHNDNLSPLYRQSFGETVAPAVAEEGADYPQGRS